MRRFILTLSSSLVVTGFFILLVGILNINNTSNVGNTALEKINEAEVPLGIQLINPTETNNLNDSVKIYYKDIEKHWAKESIIKVLDLGYLVGETNDLFMPNKNITKADFITVLAKLANVSEKGVSSFLDISSADEYYNSIAWAEYKGIIKSESENFYPNKEITREELAYMLANYLTNVEEFILIRGNNYDDENTFNSYAVDSIYYLRGTDIMNSKTDNEFMPNGKVTKAELAVIINRVLDKLN